MSRTMVARNGHPPTARPRTTNVPLLAVKVDQLHRFRTLLAQAEAAERQLAGELLAGLRGHGLARLAGVAAIARVTRLGIRTAPATGRAS